MGYHCGLVILSYETDYILKDCLKDCHFKKETVLCDSSEIECTEGTFLHAYFLLEVRFKDMWKNVSENWISRIFTRINSKENM